MTGPVGKTAVAVAVSDLPDEAWVSHALVDADWLRWVYPRSSRDPFESALGIRNLAAVWANYRAADAERLLLLDIVETRESVAAYLSAVPGAEITVVRLRAPISTVHRRLEGRETAENLAWYRRRAIALSELLEDDGVGDVLVDTEGRNVREVARSILHSEGGWSPGNHQTTKPSVSERGRKPPVAAP